MRVALFVPCYVDQLRPSVGLAALELLEQVGCTPFFEPDVVCCGQPFITAGESPRAGALAQRFVETLRNAEAIVAPSGSCVATIRSHLARLSSDPEAGAIAERTFELCDFLARRPTRPAPVTAYPYRVGLHASCHALRDLGLGTPTETRSAPRADPAATLLAEIPELRLVDLARRDECCGFGGVFSVEESAVSSRMGRDRLDDHARGGAEVVTSTDVSCLLHLEGLARRREAGPRMLHVAEILALAWSGRASERPLAMPDAAAG